MSAMKRVPLSGFVGALLVLIGGTVMLGWAMQLSLLVRVLPGFTPMVFNTALCFVLAGGALLAPYSDADRYRSVTTTIGAALVLIGFYLVAAAIEANPSEAHELGGGLQHLRHTAYGSIALLLFALAFAASGFFDFLEALYRRTEPQPD